MTQLPAADVEWLDVDRFVEAFERTYQRHGHANPRDFLPPPDSGLYITVLRELVRSDLEFRATKGAPLSLDDYSSTYPELFLDDVSASSVAFEISRLRAQYASAGETSHPARRADVDPIPPEPPEVDASHRAVERNFSRAATEIDDTPLGEAIRRMGFSLLRELGRGAFSRVFLAEQEELADRPVVLKVAPDLLGEPWTLGKLQHDNIVPIHSVHIAGPLRVICMPYVGGVTLERLLQALPSSRAGLSGRDLVDALSNCRVPATTPPVAAANTRLEALRAADFEHAALTLAAQLADALAHAHDRGVLHRDLKPANILVSDDGTPLILDFNLSERVEAAQDSAAVAGTPAYMAPEQLSALSGVPQRADERGDIYALGLILFEMLSGKRPHALEEGAFTEQVPRLLAARQARAPSLTGVSPGCSAIVARCLAPNPSDRYETARALQEDITLQLEHRPLRHAANSSTRERVAKWSRRHPRLVPALAVALIAITALATLGALYITRGRTLARANAVDALASVGTEAEYVSALLGVPDPDPALIEEGERRAVAALDAALGPGQTAWAKAEMRLHLDERERADLRTHVGSLLLMRARAASLRAARLDPGPTRRAALDEALQWNRDAESAFGPGGRQAVYLQRAKLYALASRADEERAARAQAERARSGSQIESLITASEFIAAGEHAKAIPLLDAVLVVDSRRPAAWLALGHAHAKMANHSRAEACYTASLALQPDYPWTHYLRGLTHLQRGQLSLARADFDAALRLRAAFLPALVERALVRAGSNDLAGAVDDLSTALRDKAAPTRLYFMRSRLRQRLGDNEGAQSDLNEGLLRTPADVESWVARGVARLSADPEGALADFDAALRLDPHSRDALQNKASVLSERLNQSKQAIAVLDRLIALHPNYARARIGRAVLHARVGQREAAHADVEVVTALDDSAETTYQVACVYALTSVAEPRDRDRAFAALQSALAAGFGRPYLANDPDLNPIRNDPRFAALK